VWLPFCLCAREDEETSPLTDIFRRTAARPQMQAHFVCSAMASPLPYAEPNPFGTVLTSEDALRQKGLRRLAMSRLILSALLTVALAGPAWAAEPNNLEVFKDVSKVVQRYAYFTIFDSVHASVADGVVTLSGKVTMPYKASDIAKRIAKIDGVTRVVNDIDVLPVSRFDDQLRVRIARAIYSNSSLANYGLGPNPSIHIIVEHGRVTLDGVVMNDMDRQIARHVVGSFSTFGIKNELKTDDEVERDLEKL
jgi:osmotically-inducible protein OsmY